MAVGLPAETANRIGYSDRVPMDGRGTTLAGASAILRDNTNIAMGTGPGETAFILPSDAEYFQPYFLLNTTDDTALVYPPVGDTIDAEAVNGAISVETDTASIVQRVEEGRWVSVSTAAAGRGVGVTYAADRTAIEGLSPSRYPVVWLQESGREGVFAWVTGGHGAQVAADPLQGIYVASTIIDVSAGAWVRQYDGPVCPEWFGTDDAAATQAAVDLVAFLGGGNVHFSGRDYDIGSTTITVPIAVSLTSERLATLRYAGSDVALDIYGNVVHGARFMTLPQVLLVTGPAWDAGTDTTSIGVRLNACHQDTVNISEIRNFRFGLVMKALPNSGDQVDSGNCTANTINVGHIINCWHGIDFQYHPAGGGFNVYGVNQNTFIGGVIRIDSVYNHEPGRDSLYMPDVENNINTFVGVNLEKGTTERAIYCASQENLWLNCRFEAGGSGYITFTATAINNTIIGGRSASTSTGSFDAIVSNSGFANRFLWADTFGSKHISWDFNAGKILFGNGTVYPDFPISGFGTNRLQIGKSGSAGSRHYGYMREETFTQSSGTTLTANHDHYILSHGSATTVTGVAGGLSTDIEGVLSVIATTANVTLQHAAAPTSGQGKFVLKAGVDKALAAKAPVLFRTYDGNLYEV